MAVERYNAGIQRAKGLLEIAAALYNTSLSYKTRRAAEGVLQTDSRVGRVLRLSLGVNRSAPEKPCAYLFYYWEFSGNYRRRPGRLLSSLGKPLGAVNDGLSRQRTVQEAAAAARHRSLSVFRCHGLCRARVDRHHVARSDQARAQSPAGFHRLYAAQRHRGQRDDVHCFGGAPCRRVYSRRHAQMGRPDSFVPPPERASAP